MELVRLGVSDLMVSRLCLGTMMYGEGLSEAESHAQMQAAWERGINFLDSAEMYPVPQREETQGRSEEHVGRWLRSCGVPRDRLVIATKEGLGKFLKGPWGPFRLRKVAGPSAQMKWIRGGPLRVDRANIREAIEGSLRRLKTDYIDLYQIHWPDRYVPMFGDVDFVPAYDYGDVTPLEEQLEALLRAMEQGKIRHVGLSNETAWGLQSFLNAAKPAPRRAVSAIQDAGVSDADAPVPLRSNSSSGANPAPDSARSEQTSRRHTAGVPRDHEVGAFSGSFLPRVVSIQNAYSLLCRTFDSTLAETCYREKVALLAYSPLAMGLLSGKYHCKDEETHLGPESRLVKYRGRYAEAEGRYPIHNVRVKEAITRYVEIAKEYGVSPCSLALAFVLRHPLVASAVIGASTMEQLEELVQAVDCNLSDEVIDSVHKVHDMLPNPTP